jgi:hypothetical protein
MKLTLGVAARDLLARIDAGPEGGLVRTQAAVVRSLVDELDHHTESDVCVTCLGNQVKEELLRLMRLMRGPRATAAPVPLSELRDVG